MDDEAKIEDRLTAIEEMLTVAIGTLMRRDPSLWDAMFEPLRETAATLDRTEQSGAARALRSLWDELHNERRGR